MAKHRQTSSSERRKWMWQWQWQRRHNAENHQRRHFKEMFRHFYQANRNVHRRRWCGVPKTEQKLKKVNEIENSKTHTPGRHTTEAHHWAHAPLNHGATFAFGGVASLPLPLLLSVPPAYKIGCDPILFYFTRSGHCSGWDSVWVWDSLQFGSERRAGWVAGWLDGWVTAQAEKEKSQKGWNSRQKENNRASNDGLLLGQC